MFRTLPTSAKLGIFAAIIATIGLIGYGIYLQTSNAGKIPVTVMVAPNDATITLDGAKINAGTIYLVPNKNYTFSASKSGFVSKSTNQYITSSNTFVGLELLHADGTADQNTDQYLQLEAQAGRAANDKGQALSDKYPIVDKLPIQNYIYTIGYKADPADPSNNSIIITIDAAPGYRNGALQAIRDLGYDPSQYKIEFYNYTNPFKS
ncbi:MAG TPA: hypothetical protein VIQ80_02305 [Candidatus Saccharimonadales bacterium]